MTRKEAEDVLAVLNRIKEPDAKVRKIILIVHKQIATYDARKGQLRDQYEVDNPW